MSKHIYCIWGEIPAAFKVIIIQGENNHKNVSILVREGLPSAIGYSYSEAQPSTTRTPDIHIQSLIT